MWLWRECTSNVLTRQVGSGGYVRYHLCVLHEDLLRLLNTTPVVDGGEIDHLEGAEGRALLVSWGGVGSAAELATVRAVRDRLQDVVRGRAPLSDLAPQLDGVVQVPEMVEGGLSWRLDVGVHPELTVRAVLAVADLVRTAPGRLRPCANEECHLFLLDRSRAGSARWCSMATCGNRLKARRHAARSV